MDFNYNILKLEQTLRELVRKSIEKGANVNKLFDDILKGNPLEIKDKEYKDILEKYSRETLSLVLEKNLVLAHEEEMLVEDSKATEKEAAKEAEKLEKIIKSNFKKSSNYVGDVARLLEDLSTGKESSLMNDKLKKELEPYSMRSVTLALKKEVIEATKSKLDKESQQSLTQFSSEVLSAELEKDIIISMENKALATRKSYWDVLKTKEKINSTILSHYYEMYIDDVKNNRKNIYKTRTIDEINKTYNSKIENSLNMIDNVVGKVSSITLDHMENVNSNGRTISIDVEGTKIRKGGLFLARDSKIGYGKFVNTAEFLAAVEQNTNQNGKIVVKNGTLTKEDMQKIVSSIKQVIKIEKNEKITNQDARLIKSVDTVLETQDEVINGVDVTTTTENVVEKNLGSMFLGKNGIELTDGNYISEEELNLAIAKFIENKKTIARQMKVVKVKQKIAQTVAVAASVVTILGGSLMKNNTKKLVKQPTIKYETTIDSNIPIEYQKDLGINASDLTIEQQEVANLFNEGEISADNVINPDQPLVVETLTQEEFPEIEVENNLISNQEDGQALEEVSNIEVENNITETNAEEVSSEIEVENAIDGVQPIEVENKIEEAEEKEEANESDSKIEVENAIGGMQPIEVENNIEKTEEKEEASEEASEIEVENAIDGVQPIEVENQIEEAEEKEEASEEASEIEVENAIDEMQPIEVENQIEEAEEKEEASEEASEIEVENTIDEMQPIEVENNIEETTVEEASTEIEVENLIENPVPNIEVENLVEEMPVTEEVVDVPMEEVTSQNEPTEILQNAMETVNNFADEQANALNNDSEKSEEAQKALEAEQQQKALEEAQALETQRALEEAQAAQKALEEQLAMQQTMQTPVMQQPVMPAYVTNEQVMEMYGLTADQLDTIKATICHESGANLDEIANVTSCVKNRMNSGIWGGTNPYSVITASGQFESYFAGRYQSLKNGKYGGPEVDAVINGILTGATPVTHSYESFRAKSSPYGEQLVEGGNKYR